MYFKYQNIVKNEMLYHTIYKDFKTANKILILFYTEEKYSNKAKFLNILYKNDCV